MTRSRALDHDRDRIDEEASNWVVLASERELTREEQREFDAWRAADPRHERAWIDFSRTWGDIASMRSLADLAPLSVVATNHVAEAAPSRRFQIPKVAWAAVAAALVAIIAIPAHLWRTQPQEYQTQIAQSRLITLADGTQVTLGPRSSLEVKFSDGERRVELTGGEAFFEVVHDQGRPFLVEAGTSLVRVLGTKFDVNYSEHSVRVAVLQGLVQVKDRKQADTTRPAQLLRAGQRTEIMLAKPPAESFTAAPQDMTALPAQAPGAWREGRLVYENARLADLVSDVNRYYAPGVTLTDPSIADLRVTASFKVSEIPAFMSVLHAVVPVRTSETAEGAFRLEANTR